MLNNLKFDKLTVTVSGGKTYDLDIKTISPEMNAQIKDLLLLALLGGNDKQPQKEFNLESSQNAQVSKKQGFGGHYNKTDSKRKETEILNDFIAIKPSTPMTEVEINDLLAVEWNFRRPAAKAQSEQSKQVVFNKTMIKKLFNRNNNPLFIDRAVIELISNQMGLQVKSVDNYLTQLVTTNVLHREYEVNGSINYVLSNEFIDAAKGMKK